MTVLEQIDAPWESRPQTKREDRKALHSIIVGLIADFRLSSSDGKDASGRVVTNPNIG